MAAPTIAAGGKALHKMRSHKARRRLPDAPLFEQRTASAGERLQEVRGQTTSKPEKEAGANLHRKGYEPMKQSEAVVDGITKRVLARIDGRVEERADAIVEKITKRVLAKIQMSSHFSDPHEAVLAAADNLVDVVGYEKAAEDLRTLADELEDTGAIDDDDET